MRAVRCALRCAAICVVAITTTAQAAATTIVTDTAKVIATVGRIWKTNGKARKVTIAVAATPVDVICNKLGWWVVYPSILLLSKDNSKEIEQ